MSKNCLVIWEKSPHIVNGIRIMHMMELKISELQSGMRYWRLFGPVLHFSDEMEDSGINR